MLHDYGPNKESQSARSLSQEHLFRRIFPSLSVQSQTSPAEMERQGKAYLCNRSCVIVPMCERQTLKKNHATGNIRAYPDSRNRHLLHSFNSTSRAKFITRSSPRPKKKNTI
jgi:hypothetical protein